MIIDLVVVCNIAVKRDINANLTMWIILFYLTVIYCWNSFRLFVIKYNQPILTHDNRNFPIIRANRIHRKLFKLFANLDKYRCSSTFSLFRFDKWRSTFILHLFLWRKIVFFWKINELTSCVSALSFRSTRIACLDGGGLRARHISMGDGVDFKLVTSGFTTFPGLRSRRDRASCYPPSRYSWSLSAVSSGLTAKTWQDLLGNLSPPLKIYYQPLVSSNSSLLLRTPMHECSAFSSLLIANRHRNLLHPDKINLDESVKSTQRAKESVKEEESRQRFVLNHWNPLKEKFPSFALPRSRNLIFLLG